MYMCICVHVCVCMCLTSTMADDIMDVYGRLNMALVMFITRPTPALVASV